MPEWNTVNEVRANLKRGINVNALDSNGLRPLHKALYGGDDAPVMVELLLRAGAHPNSRDSRGETALHRLASRATIPSTPMDDVATVLVRGGAHVNVRDPQGDQQGYTPLHVTAESGELAVAKILLKAGAHIEAGTSFEAAASVLPAGKDPSRWSRSRVRDRHTSRDRRTSDVTPLHLVGFHLAGLHSNSVEFAELLLHEGANPQARTKHGSTPLDLARAQVEFHRDWRATVPAARAVRESREQWERVDQRFPLFERLITSYSNSATA